MPLSRISGGDTGEFFRRLASPTTTSASSEEQNTEDRDKGRLPYGGHFKSSERFGFQITSDLWVKDGLLLQLHAGPSEASWTLPLRASEEEVQSGHARYAQARKARQGDVAYFDTPTISFTFQSGNIIPLPQTTVESMKKKTPYGLEDFYFFLQLVNQPPLIPSGPDEGKHNYTWVRYTSLMFPSLLLKGYFAPDGVSFSDAADSPAGFQWTASFKVHEMSTDIWKGAQMVMDYSDFEFF